MEIVGVKFGKNGVTECYNSNGVQYVVEESVIANTERGTEFGVISFANKECQCGKGVSKYEILRKANDNDLKKQDNLIAKANVAKEEITKLVVKHKLEMKIVDVECIFDEKKIIFNFISDGRIDFRELVKDLAGIYKMRIELRQIGVRDEARKCGGIGMCGQECCCTRFLKNIGDVSTKMAKNQGLSLNPTKISGNCGRLLCCLGYENENYIEAIKHMPVLNSSVETPDGKGIVQSNNLLKKIVTVKFKTEDDAIIFQNYDLNELKGFEKIETNDDSKNDDDIEA